MAKFQILSDLNGEIAWVSGPHYGSTGDGTLWGWYQPSWLHRADIVLADKAYQVLSPSTECVSDVNEMSGLRVLARLWFTQ